MEKKTLSIWLQIPIALVIVVGLVILGNWMTFYCASFVDQSYAVGTFIYAGLAALVMAGISGVLRFFGLINNKMLLISVLVVFVAIPITYYTAYDYRFTMSYYSGYGLDYKQYNENEESLTVYDKWGDYEGSWSGEKIEVWINRNIKTASGPGLVLLINRSSFGEGTGLVELYESPRFTKSIFPTKDAPFQTIPECDLVYNSFQQKLNKTPGFVKIAPELVKR